MDHSWLGRSVRRLGRIAFGCVAFAAGIAAFGVATAINLVVTDTWFLRTCGAFAVMTAVAVLALCDRLGLLPDDAELPTTLSLSGVGTEKDPDVN